MSIHRGSGLLTLAVLSGLTVFVCIGCQSEAPESSFRITRVGPPERPAVTPPAGGRDNVVRIAAEDKSLSIFVAALQKSGQAVQLRAEGPFTIFIPADEAFAKLPDGKWEGLLQPENTGELRGLLACHIVSGKYLATDLAGLQSVKTINDKELPVQQREGAVLAGGAQVVRADIECSNGVIHVIDAVLVPE